MNILEAKIHGCVNLQRHLAQYQLVVVLEQTCQSSIVAPTGPTWRESKTKLTRAHVHSGGWEAAGEAQACEEGLSKTYIT